MEDRAVADADRQARDTGFTLIELMVVVLIIAILLAIAIPTFFGARERANERATQSNLRNASTNAQTYYADHQMYIADVVTMRGLDASLDFTNAVATMTQRRIYIEVTTTTRLNDTVYLGAVSPTGSCFWMRVVGDQALPRFAENACAARPADGVFVDDW